MNFNNDPNEETKNKWSNDPNNLILGFFYYNPKDTRLFPRKRIKALGWTINFANPNSVFLILIVIAIILIAVEH
ncbi:hypothetical protein ASF10_05840 [Flavobacterium sp. Leaf82]|uniref:DUF5808 domain-containing protein n=1 Tax=unclassified Flavobacterium TaxID=196869 RepID=UPI0006FB68BB|nr:DUF5808 domain-containing protein [Flavobacterium sp. Leaf82]KQO30025.1 hypothetical protein ASF10_05840 [Flavobacterium sp. Leaf82]